MVTIWISKYIQKCKRAKNSQDNNTFKDIEKGDLILLDIKIYKATILTVSFWHTIYSNHPSTIEDIYQLQNIHKTEYT